MCEIDKNKVNLIINLCENNDNKVPKNFKKLLLGISYASAGCKERADSSFKAVINIFRYAYSYGMDSALKYDIKNILSKWANLTLPQAKETQYDFGDYLTKIKNKYDFKKEYDMISEVVVKYIDETLNGLEILRKDDVVSQNVLENGINKVNQIKNIVIDTVDDLSEKANNYAKDIINGLLTWRDKARTQLMNITDENMLDEIIARAISWQNIDRIPTKKEYVKDKDKITYAETRFTSILKMQKVVGVAEQFFKVLDSKSNDIEKAYSLRGKIKENNSKIEEIDRKIAEWDNKVINGECTIMENGFATTPLQNDKKLIENMLKSQISMNTRNEKALFTKQMLISKYNFLREYYQFYKTTSPFDFYDIFSQVDYTQFISILNGEIGNGTIEKTELYLDSILKTIRQKDKQSMEINKRYDILIDNNMDNDKFEEEIPKEKELTQEEIFRKAFEERNKQKTKQTPDIIKANNPLNLDIVSIGDDN